MEERNDLASWIEIVDRPSVDELNRTLASVEKLERGFLIETAKRVPSYRHPCNPVTPEGMVYGLTFFTMNGTVLLTFPSKWPDDPSSRVARLYTMGNATAETISTIVIKFNQELEGLPPLSEGRVKV